MGWQSVTGGTLGCDGRHGGSFAPFAVSFAFFAVKSLCCSRRSKRLTAKVAKKSAKNAK